MFSSNINYFNVSWSTDDIPLNLKKICNINEEGCYFPSLAVLKGYSVLIMTLMTAGRLVNILVWRKISLTTFLLTKQDR